jgi:hypothetical protein
MRYPEALLQHACIRTRKKHSARSICGTKAYPNHTLWNRLVIREKFLFVENADGVGALQQLIVWSVSRPGQAGPRPMPGVESRGSPGTV